MKFSNKALLQAARKKAILHYALVKACRESFNNAVRLYYRILVVEKIKAGEISYYYKNEHLVKKYLDEYDW